MRIAFINHLLTLLLCSTLVASCGVSHNVLNEVEDDVYFSKKQQSKGKDVYVPEVDVNEIMKNNPPQYGNGKPDQTPYEAPASYQGADNTNPNAAAGYQKYLEAQQGNQASNTSYNQQGVVTTPQPTYDQSQYQNQYHTNTPFVNSGYWNNGYYSPFWGSSFYTPGFNMGWNAYNGVGFGFNFGRRFRNNRSWFFYDPFLSWGGVNNFCNPYYNSFWGYSPYDNFCNPYWGNPYAWGGYYGWNAWNNPFYWYPAPASPSDNGSSRSRVQTPRADAGSSLPRTGGMVQQPNGNNGTVQAPITPNPAAERTALPRTNQAQLINQNGQQVYVAPEQYRQAAPRTFDTYAPSVQQGNVYRQVVPPPAPQPITLPPNSVPATQQPSYNYPPAAPQQQPAPAAPPRTYPSAPVMGGGAPSFGGGTPSGGGASGGGGRVSMPRPR